MRRAGAADSAPKNKKKKKRMPVDWPDVHLPDDWHLNLQRIPVPPIPASGWARTVEIFRRRRSLPLDLLNDPAYAPESPHWDPWFRDEHDDRRRAFFAQAPAPPQEPTADRKSVV